MNQPYLMKMRFIGDFLLAQGFVLVSEVSIQDLCKHPNAVTNYTLTTVDEFNAEEDERASRAASPEVEHTAVEDTESAGPAASAPRISFQMQQAVRELKRFVNTLSLNAPGITSIVNKINQLDAREISIDFLKLIQSLRTEMSSSQAAGPLKGMSVELDRIQLTFETANQNQLRLAEMSKKFGFTEESED